MDAIDTIAHAFGTTKPLRSSDLIKALNAWHLRWPERNFLHPCVINGRAALVCQAGLSQLEPTAFAELQAIAEQFGVYLKQDNRRQASDHAGFNRRSSVSVALTFCIGLLATSRTVTADDLHAIKPAVAVASQVAMPSSGMQANTALTSDGVPVIRLRQARAPSVEQVLAAVQSHAQTQPTDQQAQNMIDDFLQQAYQAQAGDPPGIAEDLQAMANYFAHYPQAIDLIQTLRQQKLILKYQKDTWQAQAWGNEYSVDSVTIDFDTRLGAQLLDAPGCEANPACAISPADALLHELLHAKLMLLDSAHFIASGGMASGLYPFQHEHEVLAQENQLYQAMNQEDGRARPLRHRHSGTLLEVACPACTPGLQLAAGGIEQ